MSEDVFQSFIIKIWLEDTADETAWPTWRGHVTHVSTGRRRYIQELAEIDAFVAPYLQEMGIPPRGQSEPGEPDKPGE